jgi:hypothetical protein
MKVKDLFENIVKVDFAAARQERDRKDAWDKVNGEVGKIEADDDAETLTVHELAEFEEYAHAAKKKGRIPGFEAIDDVVAYILSDMELPQHITRSKAIDWFGKLNEEERSKARMIAHHVDRMVQVYEILKKKLHGLINTWTQRFGGKLPHGWDATDGAAWLDSEYTYDITALKNLKKAVELLGQ